ncbi:MAG: hypothetical protein H7X91_06300 [Burkholderiales bacterium]|nr:hypothetical protein [Burkholderiales bacterium]
MKLKSILIGVCVTLAAFPVAASEAAELGLGAAEISARAAGKSASTTGVREMAGVHTLTPLLLAATAAVQPIKTAATENEAAASRSGEMAENRALSEIEKLFTYFEEVQKLTSAERLQEYELLKRTWSQDRSEYMRLQLAMLLSDPDSTFHDEARAQSLIDPILKEKSPRSRLRPIAYLISILLAEQRGAEEELRVLKEALQGEAERNRTLEQKLEALKTLEKNLIERESGNSPKTP